MSLIVKNIVNFMKSEKVIFCVLLLCVATSSFVLCFSYGIYHNYNMILQEGDASLKEVYPEIQENMVLTKGDFQTYLEALSPKTQDAMDLIYTSADLTQLGYPSEEYYFPMRFVINDGKYIVPAEIRKIWEEEDLIIDGRYLSDIEESLGMQSAILSVDNTREEMKNKKIGDTVDFLGQTYTVVGTYRAGSLVPLVPFQTVPSELMLETCSFRFSKPINRMVYDDLRQTAQAVLPGVFVFPDLPVTDLDSMQLYRNILLISVLISLLSVMNYGMLYSFIVKKRKYEFTVFRICGATKLGVVGICLGECILITVPAFVFGAGIFYILYKAFFDSFFPYMRETVHLNAYMSLFLLYMMIMMVCLVFIIWKNVDSNIKDGVTEGRI